MKNKVFIVIAIIIVLMVAQFGVLIDSVKAETITGSDGDVSWSFDSETKTLIFSGNGVIRKEWGDNIKKSGIVSIVINDGITSIGKNAFHYCDNLTSVIVDSENKNYCSEDGILFNKGKTEIIKCPAAKEGGSYTIPSSVTSIGENAFWYCKNLTSITIPSSVTSIGENAFWYCKNLTSIIVDGENKNYCSEDGILFNRGKTEIIKYPVAKEGGSYTIPSSVTSIGENAFSYCKNLISITIPSSVTSIGENAFSYCKNLTSITIPSSVTSIGENAFCDCYNLTSVTIPSSVTSIGDFAFSRCYNLTSVIVDSENKNYCSEDGILFNKGKTEIIKYPAAKEGGSYTIPSSVTRIGHYAFRYCKNLTSITIPSSVTSIGGYAFWYCKNLTSITIPSSVTRIGNFAFDHCQNLTIYCKSDSDAPIYAKESRVTYQIDDNAPRITSLVQEGEYIKIEATDDGVGLDNEAYSINGKDWQESNTFIVTESGKYKIHVRDALDNIAEKEIEVASFKENDGDTNKDDSKDNTEDKTDENKNNKQENKTPSKDDTQAPSKIPQTGTISIFSIFIILGIISVISYKKFKKNNY